MILAEDVKQVLKRGFEHVSTWFDHPWNTVSPEMFHASMQGGPPIYHKAVFGGLSFVYSRIYGGGQDLERVLSVRNPAGWPDGSLIVAVTLVKRLMGMPSDFYVTGRGGALIVLIWRG